MPSVVLPNSWVLLTVLVGAVVLVRYLARTPRDYPLRGKLMAVAVLAIVALSSVLAVRSAPVAVGAVDRADRVRTTFLESRPADSLTAYVPIPPMVEGVRPADAPHPELGGNRPSTRWTARVGTDGGRVVRYYRDPSHHAGWGVELSADSMLVLAREHRAYGQRGVERMRIQLRAPAGIEYELTRRY